MEPPEGELPEPPEPPIERAVAVEKLKALIDDPFDDGAQIEDSAKKEEMQYVPAAAAKRRFIKDTNATATSSKKRATVGNRGESNSGAGHFWTNQEVINLATATDPGAPTTTTTAKASVPAQEMHKRQRQQDSNNVEAHTSPKSEDPPLSVEDIMKQQLRSDGTLVEVDGLFTLKLPCNLVLEHHKVLGPILRAIAVIADNFFRHLSFSAAMITLFHR